MATGVRTGFTMSWHGRCLALGLMRDALHSYCLGWCSALLVCTRLAWLVREGQGGSCSLVSPPLHRPALRVAGCPFLVSPVLACWCAIPGESLVRLPFWCAPRAYCEVVRSQSLGVRLPPFPCLFARAPREVPLQVAGRAVRGRACPSAFPARVLCSACLAWGGWPGPRASLSNFRSLPERGGSVWPGSSGWLFGGGGWWLALAVGGPVPAWWTGGVLGLAAAWQNPAVVRAGRGVFKAGVGGLAIGAKKNTSRAARKTRRFFITRHDPSRCTLPPFSSYSSCTSLPTLVPITPLALQLRRRPWGNAVNPSQWTSTRSTTPRTRTRPRTSRTTGNT